MKDSVRRILAAGLIGVLALAVRLPGLGEFMTADEENWMLRSAGFYHNLFRNKDTGGAFMTTHPGAVAMWVIGAGEVFQETRLGFDVDQSNLNYFRKAATYPMALILSLLVGLATWLLLRLFGFWPGLSAGAVLALEPYLIGMSQVAHLDMLLALFMLNSVLMFFEAQSVERKAKNNSVKFKIFAGIFAGLAMATKLLPAVWLFVFFGLVLLWQYRTRIGEAIRQLGFLFGVSMLVFYVAWPALWFTSDLGRSFNRDIPSVVQNAHVELETAEEPIEPAGFYVRTVLGRTTPFVLILVLGAVTSVLYQAARSKYKVKQKELTTYYLLRTTSVWLLIYAIGFLVMITFAAKKADRYAIPGLVALPVLAGLGLSVGIAWLERFMRNQKSEIRNQKLIVGLSSGIVLLLLLAQVFLWSPHTIAYDSPLWNIRPSSQQGWGEGLEAAATWLNTQPLAEELYVASWYPGVMQTYFRGKTFSLSSRDDTRVSYVVLYRNMAGRAPDTVASDVLDEYRDRQLEHTVFIQDVPYAWIYATTSTEIYKQHIGELRGQTTVGQLVPVRHNNWSAVGIGMANFSNRHNTHDVILHVRESLEAESDVRTVTVNAQVINDGVFHRFQFESIPDSAGKTYYIFLESPTSQPGDAVTVRFANHDVVPGDMVRNGVVLTGRDLAFRVY